MTPQEEADNILRIYANICADVEMNKNLEKHLADVNAAIREINQKIDEGLLKRSNVTTFYEIGYYLYHLRDEIKEKIKNPDL